ncbi:Carboxylesterase family-domain-containing protein [Phyllosticta paracitricarpa]|uniref:Carboxylesterase family-domain-containing protein n=1 Tax=Phyllosticta paracitricarpa TaxID=2016321 RepID=A0ABR1NDM2_9PEZI
MWSSSCLRALFVLFLETAWVSGLPACQDSQELPILTLPYARVRARSYDEWSDCYTFSNIPFAAKPVGENRWRSPQPPEQNDTLIDGSYGPSCIQGQSVLSNSGNRSADSAKSLGPQSEDCLYLDVVVPGKAVRDPQSFRLPVIQYVYGGSYYTGSKTRNDGSNIVKSSGNNVIYVAANYRVGAFGFLAGDTMEKEATPNAGLHDIHAAFKWTHRFISLVGGDPKRISAWGESAGAGSLFALLTAHAGTQDPLFRTAVLQSPAIDFAWDRQGTLETRFRQFADAAGCVGQGVVACLRNASAEALVAANAAPSKALPFKGRTPWAPAADGTFLRQMPRLEYEAGNFWPRLDALAVSHTGHEGVVFVDASVDSDERWAAYTDFFFSPVASVAREVAARFAGLRDPRDRVERVVEQGRIVCNARLLVDRFVDAGLTRVYNMVYYRGEGLHGSDVGPTFATLDPSKDVQGADVGYQSYLISLARAGDPNTYRLASTTAPSTVLWPQADVNETRAEQYERALRVVDEGYVVGADPTDSRMDCGFWSDVAVAVTNEGGYAPPGSVRNQSLVPQVGDPSARYYGSGVGEAC